MKIKIDFDTFASIGNVNNDDVPNNLESFKKAKKMYDFHLSEIEDSIAETIENGGGISIGSTVEIPTGHLANKNMITRIKLLQSSFDGVTLTVQLENVNFN